MVGYKFSVQFSYRFGMSDILSLLCKQFLHFVMQCQSETRWKENCSMYLSLNHKKIHFIPYTIALFGYSWIWGNVFTTTVIYHGQTSIHTACIMFSIYSVPFSICVIHRFTFDVLALVGIMKYHSHNQYMVLTKYYDLSGVSIYHAEVGCAKAG